MGSWTICDGPQTIIGTLDGGGVNSLDEEALSGLDTMLGRVERDEDVRALVLSGAGSTFPRRAT